MKKIIDVPDEIVKELKIMAINDDSNLKNYIESLIKRHHEFSKITELASLTIDDGQTLRSFSNYLLSTFYGLKNKKLDNGYKFNNHLEFFEYIKDVCDFNIKILKNE